jgi:hypothetical protein
MGSTGSGNFTDYKSSNSNSGQGGDSGEDRCTKAFNSSLEDVQACQYFIAHGNIPPINTNVNVVFIAPRLAVTDASGLCIGYLPTKFNYLKSCMNDNFNYSGIVSRSSLNPIPFVSVDIVNI